MATKKTKNAKSAGDPVDSAGVKLNAASDLIIEANKDGDVISARNLLNNTEYVGGGSGSGVVYMMEEDAANHRFIIRNGAQLIEDVKTKPITIILNYAPYVFQYFVVAQQNNNLVIGGMDLNSFPTIAVSTMTLTYNSGEDAYILGTPGNS